MKSDETSTLQQPDFGEAARCQHGTSLGVLRTYSQQPLESPRTAGPTAARYQRSSCYYRALFFLVSTQSFYSLGLHRHGCSSPLRSNEPTTAKHKQHLVKCTQHTCKIIILYINRAAIIQRGRPRIMANVPEQCELTRKLISKL